MDRFLQQMAQKRWFPHREGMQLSLKLEGQWPLYPGALQPGAWPKEPAGQIRPLQETAATSGALTTDQRLMTAWFWSSESWLPS